MGPWTSSSSSIWERVTNAKSQAHPRPTEIETGVEPSNLSFNKQVILLHTQV